MLFFLFQWTTLEIHTSRFNLKKFCNLTVVCWTPSHPQATLAAALVIDERWWWRVAEKITIHLSAGPIVINFASIVYRKSFFFNGEVKLTPHIRGWGGGGGGLHQLIHILLPFFSLPQTTIVDSILCESTYSICVPLSRELMCPWLDGMKKFTK